MSTMILTTCLLAASPVDLADQAATAFAEGLRQREAGARSRAAFRAAVAAYEEMLEQGVRNPLLYRNLGNARLLADDLPGAILAYRQGLRLAPTDAVLRDNLAQAREQVVYQEGSALGRPPEDRPAVHGPGLFALALTAYAGGWVLLTRGWMVRRGALLLMGLALVVLVGTAGFLLWREQAGPPPRPLVVLAANDVFLRRGNGLSFPPRYDIPLQRGVEAELLHRRAGWLQIELAGGEIGWIRETEALVE